MKFVFLVALAAAQPQQFDLLCTADGTPERLRVDLAKGKWCEGDCAAQNDIAKINTGSIFFDKESPEEEARRVLRFRAVNRVTGEYWHVNERLGMRLRGKCEPTGFSGFPEIKTKF